MTRPDTSGTAGRRRRGLAPLEMVLALPILLFIMALIINYGTVAGWKVRGLAAARHALWSTRWPRSASASPRPEYWPPSADLGTASGGPVGQLDDPRVDLPVVRGPLPNGFLVHRDQFDPTRGLREGDSRLVRHFPLLARLGPYDQEAWQRLLDNMWQYQRTDWPEQGQCIPENTRNRWRRIPVLYRLPPSPSWLVQAYVTSAYAILRAPFYDALRPLETWKDDEFVGYARRFGWPRPRRDFHPRLEHFCTLDRAVADQRVQDLIDHVQGKVERDEEGNVILRIPSVAEVLADGFIGLYQRVIQELQSRMNAVPPPRPWEVAGMQAEISQLRQKISILERFRFQLQNMP